MKLSEAILLGSVGSEQGFGCESIFKGSLKKCALGAALLAVGKECASNTDRPYTMIGKIWPWVTLYVDQPVSDTKIANRDMVLYFIYTLNDTYHWTRPQIAAWVATLEAIYDPTPKEVPLCPLTTTLPVPSIPLVDSVLVGQTT